MAAEAPYGSWPSPITPDALVEQVVGLSFPLCEGDVCYWIESRPSEGGRQVIVRRTADGTIADVLPEGYSARTLVHEYGGMCYAVRGQDLFFSNFADQRIYLITYGRGPQPITPPPPSPRAYRYGDQVTTEDGGWLVCVRERHEVDEVVNELVVIPADGSAVPRTIASGHDFFSAPRLDGDGRRLAWLTWDHPRMPWDGTELWEAEISPGFSLSDPRLVAGGPTESISQPLYSPDGQLHYISDRPGWWNLYVADEAEPGGRILAEREVEFCRPDWLLGQSSYAFAPDGIVATWSEKGVDHLGVLPPEKERFVELPTEFTSVEAVKAFRSGVVAVAGASSSPSAVVYVSVPAGESTVIKPSAPRVVDDAFLSTPRPIEFPTEEGSLAHGLFYPPANQDFRGPPDEKPPLIVMSHGGPTSAASSRLNYGIQFWTSRGFALVDVDYRGSTGYGRQYREKLKGNWGVADVEDCLRAAGWLAEQGLVDEDRFVIRGGSAGGYTTLCALTFRRVFACGASHYGVADLGALAEHTHKFESRYLDSLIGPWPEARALYEERSPVLHAENLRTPVILFQGLEDEVVPPDQAERMVDALRRNGVPFAYVAYEGEQHGFRKAENIKRTAEAELYFYGVILGFGPSDRIEPIHIENQHGLQNRRSD